MTFALSVSAPQSWMHSVIFPATLVWYGSGLALRWDDTELIISEAGLVTTASRDALLTVQAHCEAAPAAGEDGETVVRVPETEVGAVALLDKYAQRTYAPATDASRLSGAGAGTTDND